MSLLVALCLAAAADAGVLASPPLEWDVPGLLQTVPVSNRSTFNGLPLTIVAARSSKHLDDLLVHYAQRFAAKGFYLPPPNTRVGRFNAPRVMAYDPVGRRSYLVYGWREEDRTTTLILGSADLGARTKAPVAPAGDEVPLFPGAKSVARFELEVSRALTYEARATGAEVLDFYRTTLAAAGWAWHEDSGSFVKQGRALEVLSKSDPTRQGVLGVVVLDKPDLEGLPEAPPVSGTGASPGTP